MGHQKATAMAMTKTAKPRSPRKSKKNDTPAIKVFNIYYREEQKAALDKDFVPYDNSGNNSHLLEFDVFRKLHGSEQTRDLKYWGALSWKFQQKTGLTGRALLDIIEANPGHDCYFCNPHPEIESIYHNVWVQGEAVHPNFLSLSRAFFKAAELNQNLLDAITPSKYFASANYFVANAGFWHAYLAFISQVLDKAEKNLSLQVKQAMHSSYADSGSLHADAGYWPFIIERLFSVFLIMRSHEFGVFKFPVVGSRLEENVHHKLLLQMKDAAWQSKSNWLAVCWVNYRNLYLNEVYGREWVRVHLEAITPNKVEFVK